MPKHCLVQKGEIVKGPMDLPKNWKNISNFPNAGEAKILAYGWWPVEEIKPSLDEETEKLEIDGLAVDDKAKVVLRYWVAVKKPEPTIGEQLSRTNNQMVRVLDEILAKGLIDKTQLSVETQELVALRQDLISQSEK